MPRDLIIEQVGDAETLEQFCCAAVVGFGFPDSMEGAFKELWASVGVGPELPVRHYLGRLDGKPVATSSLILGAGVAGVYIVATLPEARRQGIGAAMTLAPCRDALALGYRVAVLEASEMSYRVYQKIGFRDCCKTPYYGWKSGTQT